MTWLFFSHKKKTGEAPFLLLVPKNSRLFFCLQGAYCLVWSISCQVILPRWNMSSFIAEVHLKFVQPVKVSRIETYNFKTVSSSSWSLTVSQGVLTNQFSKWHGASVVGKDSEVLHLVSNHAFCRVCFWKQFPQFSLFSVFWKVKIRPSADSCYHHSFYRNGPRFVVLAIISSCGSFLNDFPAFAKTFFT